MKTLEKVNIASDQEQEQLARESKKVLDAIIEKRKPLAQKIATVIDNLDKLNSVLSELEAQRHKLMAFGDDSITAQLEVLDLAKLKSAIDPEIIALNKLKSRFARKTLNLGVFGIARQGKSRLLQSITGLNNTQIPASDGGHCTGVRSTIIHQPEVKPYAKVYFHSEQSFLDEVIKPYYLDPSLELGRPPFSLSEWASHTLPDLVEDKSASAKANYEKLKKYHQHFSEYSHLLKETAPITIEEEQIEEYVAQYKGQDQSHAYYNFMAVKEVAIYCSFPNENIGKLAVIDLPGLGDTGIGHEEQILQALENDTDFILFVRKPNPQGDIWNAQSDIPLYEKAQIAFNEIPLKRSSFMVFNRIDGSNSNERNCERMAEEMGTHHIEVEEYLIVNATNPQEVQARLINRVLSYLSQNIETLDRQYASKCQDRLKQLQSQIEAELVKAQRIFGQTNYSGDTQEVAHFEGLFQEKWKELTSALDWFVKDWNPQEPEYEQQADHFRQGFQDVIDSCQNDLGIPTVKEIEERSASVGGYPIAYSQYLNEIRSHLSRKFLSLDDSLSFTLTSVKSQVADILIEKAKLGFISSKEGADFLEDFYSYLPDQILPGKDSQIKYGVQILLNFTLSYRGMVMPRIRRCFDDLTPNFTQYQCPQPATAENIQSRLEMLADTAVYECEEILEEILQEPATAGFAMAEEFVDRVCYSSNAASEWRILMLQERGQIWPSYFNKLGEQSRLRVDWQKVLESAANANRINNLMFIEA
jgi:hypothetical protein